MAAAPDPDLDKVVAWLRSKDPTGAATAQCVREAIDEVLRGPRVYDIRKLSPVKQREAGLAVEDRIRTRFKIPPGAKKVGSRVVVDYSINGINVDCKFTVTGEGWMI